MANEIMDGTPTPLGPTLRRDGANFAIFSAHATAVELCLFSKNGEIETDRIALKRTGDIWHVWVKGVLANQLYGYRVDGPYAPHEGHRFNKNKLLIDPYAKQLSGDFKLDDAIYGFDKNKPEQDLSFDIRDSAPFIPKCVVGEPDFDWAGDKAPRTNLSETILYECHVKGATQLNKNVPKTKRGTPEGLSSPAMVKHLKALGVTAIEILPVQSFMSEPRLLEMGLTNYWGYNPVNYFAPHNPYLGPAKSKSIQTMVKALHAEGIEVILDVVYNHTAESWELGPTLSYRGIDNKSYYHLKDDARYYENYTGCGNALDMTQPAVLDLTISSLKYWVEHYHFDGFRFDLGPTMGRNPREFDRGAPFFKALSADPVLSKVKLIAEPWDIGPNGYQLGGFPRDWSEWNDQYRDTVRSFWRGDSGAHQQLAGRLLGSAEQFDHDSKNALTSINFISAHDGFTLQDTVSYNHKHNSANGEDNRDGHGHNLSDNMGTEGPSGDPDIKSRRQRRKINMLATLLLSQGVPMLLGGDEIGQSQRGNNNAYCQDNEIAWLNWDEADADLIEAVSALIALRKRYPHFTQASFLHGEDVGSRPVPNVTWVNQRGETLMAHEWEDGTRGFLGLVLTMAQQGSVFIALNRGESTPIRLPQAQNWESVYSSATRSDIDHLEGDTVSVFYSSNPAIAHDVAEAEISVRAESAGVISEFRDISGHIHIAASDTKQAILDAMGDKQFQQNIYPKTESPAQIFGAEALQKTGKVWGITAALYGLKSARNWGIGDFEDLAQLAELMADRGAAFVGINPVHALFPAAPDLFAPYSPSSRERLNVMHIAPDKIPELSVDDFSADSISIATLREQTFVDYDAVYTLKMQAFDLAFKRFEALPNKHKRKADFENYKKSEGWGLRLHAIFEAIFETLENNDKNYNGFKNFPKSLQSPDTPETALFAKEHAQRVEFYSYLQWIAEAQLQDANARAKAAGMSIGLYLDFAVGVVPGGSDAWRYSSAFAQNMSLGAPGDAANPDGQMWNLLPFDPHRLVDNDFEPYRSMLAKTMRQAGAVRIDHILGHMRSFWTVVNANGLAQGGAYVRYPLHGLLEMIAEESQKAKCIIIGEDLGTVPDGLRHEMEQVSLMGCGIAIIERDSHNRILPLKTARALSLTAFSNHDFPTLAGFWDGQDFEWRQALGISADAGLLAYERERREKDKGFMLFQSDIDGDIGGPFSAELSAQLHKMLGECPALAVAVQLEDLLLQREQPNVPGTTDEQPNWRRKYSVQLEHLSEHHSVTIITKALRAARP